ncbi:hypothetical protein ACN4EK_04215 [Pantanalinema rosaneae CENA516]|uniref:hypothetical protein n=1 Tax=Pantanalinema rosaneae TaxID=1620701 RepID=UPI003D6F5232
MKDPKTFQWLIVCAIGLGITLLWGCQNTERHNLPANPTTSVFPQTQKTILTYGDYLEQYPRNAPVENVMEYVLRYGSPEFGSLRDSVLKEKPKFRRMASACLTLPKLENGKVNVSNYPMPKDGKVDLLAFEFMPPIQVEPGVYLLRLRCGRGIIINSYSLFIYTEQEGIDTDALKLSVGAISKSGEFYTYRTTETLMYRLFYDANTQKLQVSLPCNASAGTIASRTVYKYENKHLSLVEYWQDNPKNDRCIQKPHLRQFYP